MMHLRTIALSALILGSLAGRADAQTTVPSGNLVGSQTWTAAGSPYLVAGDLTVPGGLTLTLQPGTVVQMGPGDDQAANLDTQRAELRIAGTLTVNGNAGAPVRVISAAAVPATSDFYGVVVLATGSINATALQVERGHRGLTVQNTGAVLADLRLHDCNRGFIGSGGSAMVTGGEVLRSASYGIDLSANHSFTGTALRVDGGSSRGVHVAGAALNLSDSIVSENSSYGIYITSGSSIQTSSLNHNTIYSNNSYGMYFTGSANNRVTARSNIVSDNRTYGFYRTSSPQVTASHNLTWNSGSSYSGVSAGTGAIDERPLFVDGAGGNYNLTSNSGARMSAFDGQDIGALPYAGAATVGLLGHLYANTLLSAAGSPHTVLGDLTVESGVTLTIEAGAEVRFASSTDQMGAGDSTSRTELRVQGNLQAVGTSGNRVLLTTPNATAGAWQGVRLLSGAASSSLDYVTIRYATYGLRTNAPATNTVQRTDIVDSSSYGLWADGGAMTFNQMRIFDGSSRGAQFTNSASGGLTNSLVYANSSYGVYATSGSSIGNLSFTGNTIVDNNSYGMYFTGSSNNRVTASNNIVVGNRTYGIYRTSSPQVTASYNLVWDNANNYSGVSAGTGAITENPLFVDQTNEDFRITSNSPARTHASGGADMGALAFDGTATVGLLGHLYVNTILTQAGSPHYVQGDLTVEPGVTLTIEPGSTLEFAASADAMGGNMVTTSTELRVLGTLVADGTTSRRITFTTRSAAPARGQWYGVHLLANSQASIIDFATIEYARYGVRTSAPSGTVVQRSTLREQSSYAVWGDGGATDFSQLIVRDNANRGFHMVGASGTISNCQVFDNASYGIYATSGSQISNLSLLHNTVADNNSYGMYLTGSSNNRVTIRNNIVAGNRTYGVYRTSSPQVTASYNLVWDNSNNYSGVSAGTGAITENPLFVDLNNSDYRITSRSPARTHALDGSDMGALAYDGAITVGEQGHMYADVTWAAAASPITVLGDITVEQGVTLTIEAGTTVNITPSADSMGANSAVTSTELIVQGRLQVNGTSGAPVLLTTGSTPGTWYGVHLLSTAANTSIRNAQIRNARYGLRSSAPSSASMTQSEISDSSSYGAYIDGGAIVLDGVWVHDGQSRGVHVQGASPSLLNLLVTDNSSYGVYASSGSSITNTTMNHLTVDNNNSYGIYLTGSSNNRVTIRNTSVTNNRTYGIYRTSSPQVTLGRNNVWTNTNNYSGVSAGSGSLSANPQFVNAALGNYQLLPSSTLIDAANPATALSSDFEGTARPIDGDTNMTALPDLGAFEFNPSNNRWPIADAGPDRVATAGLTISFDATGSNDPDGTISTYAWNFGDGTTGTGVMVSHTFTGGTDRTVTLTVTDNLGAQDVDTIFVEVNLAPIAEAGPPKFGDPGEIISFVGSGSSDSDGTVVSYAWNFGDSTVGTGQGVTHTYNAPGNYNVILTITDDDGATGADTTTVNISGADTTPPTIVHAPVSNGQTAGQPVMVSANVTDASGLSSVTLMYRAIGGGAFVSAAMSNTSGGTYVGTVPGTAVNAPGVEYYVAALDNAMPANSASQPGNAPVGYFTFIVNAAAAPVVTHTPVGNGQAQGQAISVTADVTAAGGLSSVVLYYRAQGGGAFTQAAMIAGATNTYQAQIPSGAVLPPAVEYYIGATDSGTPAQTTTHPASMGTVHAFTVTASDMSAPSITHVPIAPGQAAGQAVAVSASVTDPSGVQSVQLYYRVGGGGTFASAAMQGSGGNYSATIPGASVSVAGVEYYIEAQDQAMPANVGTHPPGAPTPVHSFTAVRVFNVSAGDIVISEVMADPSGTESVREWIELYNSTAGSIDVDGFTVSDDGVDAFTINNGGPLTIASGAYLVLGRNADTTVNGGVTVDYVYSGMALANTDDEVVISAGALEIDRVAYDAGATFVRTPGRSITLDPDQLDALANDSGGSWCAGASPMASGDFGSPGTVNDSCQDVIAPVMVHTPIADGQQANLPVSVSAVVTDDSGLSVVEAFYRVRGQGAYVAAAMTLIGGDVYQGEIPAGAVTTAGVEYYVRAVDAATPGNEALEPAGAPLTVHTFDVTTDDTSGPSINHNPVQDEQDAASAVEIIASVADPSGVQEVLLYYRVSGQAWQNVAITDLGQNVFLGEIPAASVTAAGVEYYLAATDTLANASSLPAVGEAGPFTFTVLVPDNNAPSILHTPIADGQPEGVAINVQAEVKDAAGLSEVRLYFRASGDVAFLSAAMTGVGDTYSAELPAALIRGAGLDYYIEAIDGAPEQNTARDPMDAPSTVHSFTVGAVTGEDLDGPSILHLGVSDGQIADRDVLIVAEVSDPSGVRSVSVRYRTRGGTDFVELALSLTSGSRYEGSVPGAAVGTPGMEYYIVASDQAPAMNVAQRPETAPAELLSFTVVDSDTGGNPREEGGCRCVQDARTEVPTAGLFGVLVLLGGLMRRRRK